MSNTQNTSRSGDLNAPVAHSGETLVHLHFINPDTNDRSTWIGEATSQRLHQDPATFRRTLDVSIDLGAAIDLAWYAEHYGDTEWMVHIEGPDDCITHRDEAATVPLAEKDARDLARAVNMTAVREREASEFAPFMNATVFHHGVPVPDDEDEPVDITAVRTKLYHQGTEYLNERRHYFKVMNHAAGLDKTGEKVELGKPGFVAAWMYEALVSAGTFQWTLAAILRLLEQDAPEIAQKVGQIVEAVQDAGIEAIEDANDDLPEPTPVAAPVVDATAAAVDAR